MSTARVSMMRRQVGIMQSCSPPVTSMSSASATSFDCSISQ